VCISSAKHTINALLKTNAMTINTTVDKTTPHLPSSYEKSNLSGSTIGATRVHV